MNDFASEYPKMEEFETAVEINNGILKLLAIWNGLSYGSKTNKLPIQRTLELRIKIQAQTSTLPLRLIFNGKVLWWALVCTTGARFSADIHTFH